jgi:hypothetical protein
MARTIALWAGLLVGVAAMAASVLPVKPLVGPVVPKPEGVLAGVSASDAAILRSFYEAMADIVVRDGKAKEPSCKTVFDLRNRHKFALSMAFENTGMVGRYVGLGQRLDEYLIAAIGDKDLPLTPELRQSASRAFSAIR